MPPEEKEPQNQRGTAPKKAGKGVRAKRADKEARLAEALRANLRRRKAGQAKGGDQE